MKVVIHNGAREWRGNEKQTATLATELTRRGHDVVVSCDPGGALSAELARRGVRTTGIRPRGDVDVVSALRFAAWLRRERADAVLLTTWKRVPWGAWAAKRGGVPRVVVRNGIARALPGARRFRVAFRRWVDGLVVNSRAVRDAFVRSAPEFPPERVHVVLNGVEIAPSFADGDPRGAIGVPGDAPLVAAVGGVERRKGYDLLLHALAEVPGAVAAIAGEGPAEAELRALSESLGVADRVRWLGQRKDVGAVLAAADAFALPSRNEGMAVVMLEAMHAGLPVVAADVSGVWDALAARDGRPAAGWIVPAEDPRALAAALREVLGGVRASDGAVRERTDEARWRLEHWFTIERMVDGVEAALRGAPPATE